MKKYFMVKSKSIFVLVLYFTAILSIGCSTKYNPGELLKPYYVSSITKEEDGGKKIPVSIRVKSLDFTSPSAERNGSGVLLSLIPIVSAIPQRTPESILTNARTDGGVPVVKRVPGEVEKVLTEELNKLNLFDQVVFEGDQKDYDIKGRVDFKLEVRSPLAGFGILYVLPPVLIFGSLFTPLATFKHICEAHFDVVDTKTNKIIFSKDYNSEKTQLTALFYGESRWTLSPVFGERIFPPIVKEFTSDLKVNLQKHLTNVSLNSK
jgi:hypothetical protein